MRVVIAEDSAVLREGLVDLLTVRDGHEVVAATRDAQQLHTAVSEHDPEVSIVDIRMPPTHTDEGLRAAIELRQARPVLGILLFSQYIETRYATELLAQRLTDSTGPTTRGGVGYLLKDRVAEVADFLDALRRVGTGETVLDPEVVSQLLGATRKPDAFAELTDRERTVLELMAQGRSNSAISAQLYLSAGSIEKYVTTIFGKLNLAPSDGDNRRVLAVLRYLAP